MSGKFDKYLGKFREKDGGGSGGVTGVAIGDGEVATPDGDGVVNLPSIGPEDIIVRKEWSDDIQDYYKYSLADALSEVKYLKMGAPDYSLLEEHITRDTDQYAEKSGWIIVNARSDSSLASPIEVIIDGSSVTKMSCATEHWQSIVVPVMESVTWSVAVPGYGDEWIYWEIKFLPCTPLYNI